MSEQVRPNPQASIQVVFSVLTWIRHQRGFAMACKRRTPEPIIPEKDRVQFNPRCPHWLPASCQPTRTERHSAGLASSLFPRFCAS
jgi:hypothetical protein